MEVSQPGGEGTIGQSATGALILMGVLLGIVGCVSEPDLREDEDLQNLLQAYRERNAELDEQRRRREEAAIRRLEVDHAPDAGFLVSVDLSAAPLPRVIGGILEMTMVPFNLSTVRLTGSATARFDRLPLLSALNQLLNPHGISVASRDGVLMFRHGGQIDRDASIASPTGNEEGEAPTGEAGAQTLYREIVLQHLAAAEAVSLLQNLYGGGDDDDDDDGATSMSFGAAAELNTVYLAGASALVSEAVALLNRADREVPHVLIEALVVELDVTAAVTLGANITDAASGDFGGINLLPGQIGGNLSFSFLEGAANPTQLAVLIDLLVSQDKAQILSRPYLAARSNREARIEIVNERFVAVERSDAGAAITSAESIAAGVQLQITPMVQADGMIRVDLQVEESQFVPTVGDVVVQKARNTARTAMSVRSGQTIVVGGLNLRRLQTVSSGLPWLRRVPLLNLLFAEQASLDQNKEVVVYLTPRLWAPAIDSPLDLPGVPRLENRPLTDFERLEGARP